MSATGGRTDPPVKPDASAMVALAVGAIIVTVAVHASLSPQEPAAPAQPLAEPPATMRFGLDAGTVDQQAANGIPADYAVLWAGPWLQKHGWRGFDQRMAGAAAHGVTPAIHLYYWGDDISSQCLQNGCLSENHATWKDQAGWHALTQELMDHVADVMQGGPVLIILETEFNKRDVATHEPLDGLLADHVLAIRAAYAPAEVVLGLGNWNRAAWATWDRAAAAADYVGVQGLRAFTRNDAGEYHDLVTATIDGARTANDLFDKPIVLTDIGLSSYPDEDHAEDQAAALARFFEHIDELQDAGVEVFLYRGLADNPNYSSREYFGHAEGAWGLVRADGQAKPSMDVWRSGVIGATR